MKKKIEVSGWFILALLVWAGILSVTEARAADKALIDGAKKEGKFVLYSSMPTEPAVAHLDAFRKKYPFLDTCEFFRSTSYKVYSSLNIEMEAGKHIADVVHIGLASAPIEWRKKGWLMKYDSPVYAGYPDKVIDRGYWAPMRTFAIVMAYNKSLLPASEVPKKWSDLANPKWKDQIGLEGADSGSQHLQYYALKNVLGGSFWDKITQNKPKVFSGAGAMITGLLRGEIKIAMCSYCYTVYEYREIQKAPIEGVWPEEGVPINIAPLTTIDKAPHPNAAKLFMDWSLSQEGQMEMVKIVGAYSGRPDVPSAKGNPAWGSFKPLYVENWIEFDKTQEEFKRVWQAIAK